jgi:NitT/TauT family transport system permease protein
MNAPMPNGAAAVAAPAPKERAARAMPPKTNLATLLSVPVACLVGIAVHAWAGQGEPIPAPEFFTFLGILFALGIVLAIAQQFSGGVRSWVQQNCPIVALGVVLLAIWETITAGLHWLPLPYFPGPAGVLKNLIDDRALIFDSTWHSLLLLLSGYALGVVIALITGVCIGWFAWARYWGMPFLKILGPIPATAWVPLAMVISPSSQFSAVGLIALAVWFPVTMLTISGIANTRASYLDVARTLGASESYLIFRVAIPAATPNIFIGLFMGLGTSFLTLIVAETVGVKSGLGWYVSWAQGWAEYGKVYAALVIMAAFFSTIMTGLFKLRDRVLSWQKGVIKW